MNSDKYQITAGYNFLRYEFISQGPKGLIKKQIQFKLVSEERSENEVYNLAFGDKGITGEIDDMVISNNGDTEKVLATVASAIFTFFETYSNAWIYITGSTNARTRLYKIGIVKYYSDFIKDFDIYGEKDDDWYSFEKDKNYSAFLIKRKTL